MNSEGEKSAVGSRRTDGAADAEEGERPRISLVPDARRIAVSFCFQLRTAPHSVQIIGE